MQGSPMLGADFYKIGHVFQYPPGTEYVYSNFTARSGKIANKGKHKFNGVINIGLSIVVQMIGQWFQTSFFNVEEDVAVERFSRIVNNAIGPVNTEHIRDLWVQRTIPVQIKALPEGAFVPFGVPLFTIENTDPRFYWLTNFLETTLSAELWQIVTNATIAAKYRQILESYAVETGAPLEFVDWQGHDFSMRGMSSVHSAAKSGVGHLASFLGTDTIPAIEYVRTYYGGVDEGQMIGGSVPATEHSVMCAGGSSHDDEKETIRRIIQDVYPSGVVSVVSDTWDFWNVISKTAVELKDVILNRQPNAIGLTKVVFRPDSGDPVEIICGKEFVKVESLLEAEEDAKDRCSESRTHGELDGYIGPYLYKVEAENKYYSITVDPEYNRYDKQYYFIDGWFDSTIKEVTPTPEQLGAVETLWNIFGGTTNEKGYRTLNQRVGLIYGDSITLERADEILRRLKEKGFASDNIVFGIGSFTYQYNTRDTFGLAMKATNVVINGESRPIFKEPVTDSGVKKSAKGLLKVDIGEDGRYTLVQDVSRAEEQSASNQLKRISFNENFSVVRQRVKEALKYL